MAATLDKKYLKEEEHEITADGNKKYTIFEAAPEHKRGVPTAKRPTPDYFL